MAMQKLSEEQRSFAEQNHNLVYKFLAQQKLSVSDFYDIAIFGYLEAVQTYSLREDLRRYRFSTIAYRLMHNAVGRHNRKKRIQCISLDAPTRPDEHVTLGSCIADSNDPFDTVFQRDEAERLLAHCPQRERQWLLLRARGYYLWELAQCYQIHPSTLCTCLCKRIRKLRLDASPPQPFQ